MHVTHERLTCLYLSGTYTDQPGSRPPSVLHLVNQLYIPLGSPFEAYVFKDYFDLDCACCKVKGDISPLFLHAGSIVLIV